MEVVIALFLSLVVCICTGNTEINQLEVSSENGISDSTQITSTTIVPILADGMEEEATNPNDPEGFTLVPTLSSTQEPELLYLVYEYDHLDKETFWNNNTFECIDGKLEPSSYLRMKYDQCVKIHQNQNPKCTKNCQMAITMLLGPSAIPTLDIFKRFFTIALPTSLQEAAISHYTYCFETFGNDDYILKDWHCERPQQFFACMEDFQPKMVC